MGKIIQMFESSGNVGLIAVTTSDDGGLSTEQIAQLAIDKIMFVSDTAPEPIRQQAEAFSDKVRNLLQYYIELARKEERATICYKIEEAGHKDLAEAIRRI